MVVKIGRSRETFSASFANMGFLSRMNSPVCIKTAACREPFLAEITFVWPFSGVDPHMSL